MDFQDQLLLEARAAIAELPEYRCEIVDLYTLAVTEIEDGGSTAHEYELFMGSVAGIRKEIINKEKEYDT